jgi:hypothetical protein
MVYRSVHYIGHIPIDLYAKAGEPENDKHVGGDFQAQWSLGSDLL